jgi:hypothetical protein
MTQLALAQRPIVDKLTITQREAPALGVSTPPEYHASADATNGAAFVVPTFAHLLDRGSIYLVRR